jgi:lysozyme
MRTSQNGIDFIKSFEKCKLEAYRNDPKEPWTIGWGNTFYEDLAAVRRGDKITQSRADSLFGIILSRF